MKQWKDTIKITEAKERVRFNEIVDIYKKEILDTRITVSDLVRNSRVENLPNLKINNKDAVVFVK